LKVPRQRFDVAVGYIASWEMNGKAKGRKRVFSLLPNSLDLALYISVVENACL